MKERQVHVDNIAQALKLVRSSDQAKNFDTLTAAYQSLGWLSAEALMNEQREIDMVEEQVIRISDRSPIIGG